MAETPARKKRQSSRAIQARKAAAERAAAFQAAEAARLDIATQLTLLEQQIADLEDETERQVEALRARREKLAASKRTEADQLVVAMLSSGVNQTEAAQRLGITVDQVRAAKANVEQRSAAERQSTENADGADSASTDAGAADAAGAGSATLPQQQNGQQEPAATGVTQPPGSAA
ncbi:hypothetical protein [Streptomyces sp. NPDC014733]|uniref:hypothetical protein n=1 Tax=Streptomyces sp. NPDC014733 TaxID=3364885 RepID=UPI0036F9F741